MAEIPILMAGIPTGVTIFGIFDNFSVFSHDKNLYFHCCVLITIIGSEMESCAE